MQMLERLATLIALTVCLSAVSTLAENDIREVSEESFGALDQNDDNLVSRDEFVSTFVKLQDLETVMREREDLARRLVTLESNLKQRFGRMDSDEDGQLSQSEFVSVMASEDGSDQDREESVFSRLDQDQDGAMSFEEFGDAMTRRLSSSRNEERRLEEGFRQRFVRMDSDENGSVSQTEYASATTAQDDSNQEQQEGVFTRLDIDQDGAMSFDEFGDAMKRRLSARGAAGGNDRADALPQDSAAILEERVAQRFDHMDTDRDSVLTLEEYLSFARRSSEDRTREDSQSDFDRMDSDDNESVSQDEYISAMKRRLSRRVASLEQIELEVDRQEAIDRFQQGLSERFERMDSDDSGELTRSEMEATRR